MWALLCAFIRGWYIDDVGRRRYYYKYQCACRLADNKLPKLGKSKIAIGLTREWRWRGSSARTLAGTMTMF